MEYSVEYSITTIPIIELVFISKPFYVCKNNNITYFRQSSCIHWL